MLNKNFKMSAAALANGADERGNLYGKGGFSNNIDPTKIGLQEWKPAEGENLIDIIPFNADKNNPLVVSEKAAEGEVLYSLDYFTHRDIGPGHSNITCLQQYNQDCPICRENQRLFGLGEQYKEQANKLRAKRRVVYVVHDLKTGKYGYWDTSWFQVEQELTKEAAFQINNDTGAKINVFDWEEGMTVQLMGEKDSWAGHEFIKPTRFRFVKRAPLSDEVLEHSVDLSTTVKFMSPEDMEKLISGQAVATNSEPVKQVVSEPVTPQPVAQEVKPVVQEPVAQTNFQEMKPVESASVAPTAPVGDKVCPYGHPWSDADHHPECANCQVWDKCIG